MATKTLAILSNKGGVGKTTVAAGIALSLAEDRGHRVFLNDNDIDGPNIQRILDIKVDRELEWEKQLYAREVVPDKLWVWSTSFLLPSTDTPIGNEWTPGRKAEMAAQILKEVDTPAHEYQIVDLPPGLSEELKFWQQRGSFEGVFIVSQPSALAIEDVQKTITYCQDEGIRIVGLIANMESFICEACSHENHPFGSGRVQQLAEQRGISFLGAIPMDPAIQDDIRNALPYIRPILAQVKFGFKEKVLHKVRRARDVVSAFLRLGKEHVDSEGI